MSESIGPRTYLVGKILQALIGKTAGSTLRQCADDAILIADYALDKMAQPDGKPKA